MEAGLGILEGAIKGTELEIADKVVFGEDCTPGTIQRWAAYARECRVDMIFGMGGGKALDTAKGAADQAGLPVFTFPTIAATCAATSALSVVYKEDGNFDSFYFFDKPARHCFINTRIIADAPWQYLRASFALQQAVLANIVSTGMVSLMVLDDYNCAIAHSVYYGLVLLPGFEEKYLHGDVVAYGVLVQLAVDHDMDRLPEAKKFLKDLGIPSTLREMEVPLDRAYLADVLKETVTGPDMEHIPYPVTEDMIYQAMEIVEGLE